MAAGVPQAAQRAAAGSAEPRTAHLTGARDHKASALVAAWRDPAAWEGVTEAGGVELPAAEMGKVALNELVIHGWDLARATGQPYAPDATTTEAIFELLSAWENPDGTPGLFGPVVRVRSDAPMLDRAVGLSGRDPAWSP